MLVAKSITFAPVKRSKEGGFAGLFSVLVALLPFFYQYATPIPVLSLGEAVLLPFILVYLAIDFKKGITTRGFSGFYLLMLLVITVNFIAVIVQPYASFQKSATILMRLIYYSFLIYVGCKHIRVDAFFMTLIAATTVNSVYTIAQYAAHMFLGRDLPTTLSFLPVFNREDLQGRTDLVVHYLYYFRPSGFFLEPSYAALFSAPSLLILLLHERYSKKPYSLLFAAIITIGLVIGTSSMALIAILLGWLCFAARRFVSRNARGQVVISPLGLFAAIALCALVALVLFSPLGEMTLSRANMTGGSAGQRVIRGWIVASQLDLKTFLFGTGLNNVAEFVRYFGVTTQFDENLDYLSSWSSALVSSGIFVLLGYLLFMGRLFFAQKTLVGKVFVLLFVATGFVEAMLYTYRFAFYLLTVLSFINEASIHRKVNAQIDGETRKGQVCYA
ncbi:MAG: hypothetical protein KHZ24_11740 [Coriobacteriia bacterium]|nr:hypothetical protein [Coriobacteriia bacterium]